MEKNEIKDELTAIIKPYLPEDVSIDELTEEKELINDLKINSAHIVDIVLDIEDKFDIMIEDDVIGQMNSVADAVNIIYDKVEK
ncbi:MAG: acyl carrier protein [Cyclobacteriaceae bacterium]|jgi:acyl carrier protein